MKYIERYIEDSVKEDLTQKMVFIAGPRQSGKTTLAIKILGNKSSPARKNWYLNWDSAHDREKIIREQFPAGKGLLVLDEIHKYSRWRQVVKGLFDKRKHELQIIVTGSGRLDYYRHGGDSLQGRYHFYRLYPFSFAEVRYERKNALFELLKFGGFPEQFISASERATRRWSREYRSRIIYDELDSLENVKDVALIENLSLRLPEMVGSPLSINSLRQDLQVAHHTVARWLTMLENIYMIFRVYPFGSPKIRAIKKESKHYHFDWTVIDDEGARFENLIAFHLLKWVHFKQDYEGLNMELRYFRDVNRREIDFVVMEDNKPVQFIECKLRGKEINPALRSLKKLFPNAYFVQVSLYKEDDYVTREGIHACPAEKFLSALI
ncbi:MAG: ATP-binding protein [Calditrichaeota bacterium]|nr:ATP-binding protein [Calditrichota bacterium]